jgi:hypothetical protein
MFSHVFALPYSVHAQPEHCVAWAKSKFEEYFVVQPQLLAQLQGIAQQHKDDDRVQWREKVNAWLLGLTDEQVKVPPLVPMPCLKGAMFVCLHNATGDAYGGCDQISARN